MKGIGTSPFRQLYRAMGSPHEFSLVYRDVLRSLTTHPFWVAGRIGFRRVMWTDGRRAKVEDPDAFASYGIYLWGVEDRPLYIGITRGSFDRRFNRYIWGKRSQCHLAREYGDALVKRGMAGFPSEILTWYARNFGSSKARLLGAIRFAEEDIGKVWFGLLPHANRAEIETLEPSLVSVAETWNRKLGFRSLLNVEFNRKKQEETAVPDSGGLGNG